MKYKTHTARRLFDAALSGLCGFWLVRSVFWGLTTFGFIPANGLALCLVLAFSIASGFGFAYLDHRINTFPGDDESTYKDTMDGPINRFF